MIQTTVMQDASEIVRYETPGIPLYIHPGRLSYYPDMRALCHWHDDIELIRVREGCMNYRINENKVLLNKGDCLMINARQLHYGYSVMQKDCEFDCILFHPSLFDSCTAIYRKYVQPVMENESFEYLHLKSKEYPLIWDALGHLMDLKEGFEFGYEMEAIGWMNLLWGRMLREVRIFPEEEKHERNSDLSIQRDMVSYICQNYAEKITLEQISAAGHICRSKCCEIFKHYLQQSPIEFLNRYRLEASCHLLERNEKSITEIATACGFGQPSYYTRIFQRYYGMTPREYKKHKIQ